MSKWNLNKDHLFTIVFIKHTLAEDSIRNQQQVNNQAFTNLWKWSLSINVKFFPWSLLYEKINTIDILQRKLHNFCLNPSIYALCMEKWEDLELLFLNCKLTNYLWYKLFSCVGDFTDKSSIQSIRTSICSLKPTSSENVIKFSGGATVLWSIWKERNNRTFMEKKNSTINIWVNVCNFMELWSCRNKWLSNYNMIQIALNLQAFVK